MAHLLVIDTFSLGQNLPIQYNKILTLIWIHISLCRKNLSSVTNSVDKGKNNNVMTTMILIEYNELIIDEKHLIKI